MNPDKPFCVRMGPYDLFTLDICLTERSMRRSLQLAKIDEADDVAEDAILKGDWTGCCLSDRERSYISISLNLERMVTRGWYSAQVIGTIAHEVAHAVRKLEKFCGERDGFSSEANSLLHEHLVFCCVKAIEECGIPAAWRKKQAQELGKQRKRES